MLLSTALLVGSPALAQESDPAGSEADLRGEELYRNGKALYDEGSYAAAIAAWKSGYELTGRPDFLWNVAAAQERLGDLAGARETLDAYRAFASSADQEAIDRRIRSLEARITTETAPSSAVPERRTRDGARRAIGWTLLGGGVLGVGLGGAYGYRALSARQEANALCLTGADGELWCPTTADPALEAGQRRALVSDLGFGLGGAATLGGLLLVLPISGRF